MPEPESSSAVVVTVRLPDGLERLRRRHYPAAAAGLSAHLTLLFPFVPSAELTSSARGALAEIARAVPPFETRFADVGRFPDVVYLVPEPSAPFIELTSAIAARFPEYPPYGGAHLDIVPHLTVAESVGTPLDPIVAGARRFLPFTRQVSAIEVLVQRGERRWRRRWRLRLGIRP